MITLLHPNKQKDERKIFRKRETENQIKNRKDEFLHSAKNKKKESLYVIYTFVRKWMLSYRGVPEELSYVIEFPF